MGSEMCIRDSKSILRQISGDKGITQLAPQPSLQPSVMIAVEDFYRRYRVIDCWHEGLGYREARKYKWELFSIIFDRPELLQETP